MAAEGNFETQIEGRLADNYIDAQFRLRLPEKTSKSNHPSSILCFISGSGMNGLDMANDAGWQQLATELDAALLTVHFRDSGTGKSWHFASEGSGQSLLDALKDFSLKSKNKGLEKLPIAFVGLSTGGQYAYHWACWRPEQTLCFVTLKGGHHTEAYQPGVLSIPALWMTAEQDLPFRQKNIKTVVARHLKAGAPWTLAVEPKAGHASENASRLITPYLKMVLSGSRNPPLFSRDTFTNLLNDFEAGKNLETWPMLPLNSKPLPDYAFVSPAILDFGNCISGQSSSTLEIQLAANEKSPVWDRVELSDPDKIWDLVEAPQADKPGRFRLRLKPQPDLPLGLFKSLLRFRFYQDDRLLPGGSNLSAMVKITGDVEVTPSSLYLGTINGKEPFIKTLAIKSREKKSLKWLPAKSTLPSFVTMETLPAESGTLKVRCIITAPTVSQLEEEGSKLLLCFETDKEYTVQIPVIMAVDSAP